MEKQAAILFEDFGPYHVARIQALAEALRADGWGLVSYRMSEKSATYAWNPPELTANREVVTLSTGYPSGFAGAFGMACKFAVSLRKRKVSVAFLPSYAPLPNLLCLILAKLAGCRCIMLNESWEATEKAGRFGQAIKRLLIGLFSAAVVGGNRHRAYAIRYGIPEAKVFTGYDVVDVGYFEREAKAPRELPGLKLPRRYFLNIGRFVAKKNLDVLISAYAKLVEQHAELEIALVLVGDGECLGRLQEQAGANGLVWHDGLAEEGRAPGPGVFHYPFQQVDSLPAIYAGCEAFILPSSREEWGLVVNEAMACGAPVIVSNMAGCCPDLVMDDGNGFAFDPMNIDSLATILKRFVANPALRTRLGEKSREMVKSWTPARFGSSGLMALNASLQKHGK